jgi:hypothetical protein
MMKALLTYLLGMAAIVALGLICAFAFGPLG